MDDDLQARLDAGRALLAGMVAERMTEWEAQAKEAGDRCPRCGHSVAGWERPTWHMPYCAGDQPCPCDQCAPPAGPAQVS